MWMSLTWTARGKQWSFGDEAKAKEFYDYQGTLSNAQDKTAFTKGDVDATRLMAHSRMNAFKYPNGPDYSAGLQRCLRQ